MGGEESGKRGPRVRGLYAASRTRDLAGSPTRAPGRQSEPRAPWRGSPKRALTSTAREPWQGLESARPGAVSNSRPGGGLQRAPWRGSPKRALTSTARAPKRGLERARPGGVSGARLGGVSGRASALLCPAEHPPELPAHRAALLPPVQRVVRDDARLQLEPRHPPGQRRPRGPGGAETPGDAAGGARVQGEARAGAPRAGAGAGEPPLCLWPV